MADYDVIVIGGGSAGTSAAGAATRTGANTAMINEGELGGLCILRGCMPTKAMLASAHAIHETRHLEPFGIRLEGHAVADFSRIMQRKSELVARFKQAKIESIAASSYEVIDARARFAEDGSVEVDGRRLTANSYVIATGSAPSSLAIPGIDDVPVWTSDDVMRLTKQPRALVVQGAGPVGLELAQFFARIGTEVLLVNRSPLLHRYDAAAGEELTRTLRDEPGLELALPGRIEELRRDGAGLVARVHANDEVREHRADALLVAIGRHADLDGLGLDRVGLEVVNGCLPRDAAMRTTNPKIFVAGDATGCHQILHLANQEGRVAGHNAAGGRPESRMDYRLFMQVVFTDPPYAQLGMTEDEARKAGRNVVVGRAEFPRTGRAITMETRHGVWHLIADRDTGEILGTSLLGPRADDLVHLITVMMRYGGTVSDIADLPWYHPTLSEVMLDLMRDVDRQIAAF